MTEFIGPTSPKAARAAAFGRELTKAMRTRGVGSRTLAPSVGVGRTAVQYHKMGRVLPRHALAIRYAQALDWPRLMTLSAEAREKHCVTCQRTFIDDTGPGTRLYCGSSCQSAAELDRLRGPGRRHTTKGLIERQRDQQSAIDAMCAECEPDGTCRMEDCPLRPFSPYQLDERRALPVAAAIRRGRP